MLLIHPEKNMYFHDVINALSFALDLTEGQPPGHALRCCLIGMHIGHYLNLSDQQKHDLYYTLLLKDAGCSSNAARLCEVYGSDDRAVKTAYKEVDNQDKRLLIKFVFNYCGLQSSRFKKIKHFLRIVLKVETISHELIAARSKRGAEIARQLGLNDDVAQGIYNLDEHYNGNGMTCGLKKEEIPLYSRIALLAQVIDVFFKAGGQETCTQQVNKRSGSWFDPTLVAYFNDLSTKKEFWERLSVDNLEHYMTQLHPPAMTVPLTYKHLGNIAEAFGQIIDAKSPFTAGHSKRVAYYAMKIADRVSMPLDSKHLLYSAALLHDIGMLGVSNSILDKEHPLKKEEWNIIRRHPQYTEEILSRLLPFHPLAQIAAAHHERIDGTGYHRKEKGAQISPETRVLTIADIFTSLTADRPYRQALSVDKALKLMDGLRGTVVDDHYMDALHEIINQENFIAFGDGCSPGAALAG